MSGVSIRDLSLSYDDRLTVLKSLNFDIAEGEFLVLLGPSGCGKSTLLNVIAGLLEASEGEVWIADRNVTWEEPRDRGIGMVFQSYALYPRMTVEKNLSFSLRVAGMAKAEIAERVARAAEILHIEPLLQRRPAELSGGQRQRVAIGRTLVRDVAVFLFDEPLSNLDAKLRAELRVELQRLHQRLSNTMIYVTHDQIEAMTLADRIAVMKDGVVQQLDTPHAIYNRPINRFVAGFIGSPGMNFLEGHLISGDGPVIDLGNMVIPADDYAFDGTGCAEGAVSFGIRPEHVVSGEGATAMPFSTATRVEIVEPMGPDTLVWSKIDGQNVTFRVDSNHEPDVGDTVQIGFDPARASVFNASGKRI